MTSQARLVGGRYEEGEPLGRGGMAEVRKGVDNRLGRTVAIKRLRVDLASDATFQARFRREAQSAASLNHTTIVSVYDTGEEPDPNGSGVTIPYIVMEYVAGKTLRDLIREGRKIMPERALEITSGVLEALDYSHRAGIVHRDIKPGNVMLTPQGQVKVMDFGIARAVADTSSTMTQTSAVIGTAQYLSPEQARGEQVDARSDIYSTGCLLYELLTGRPPFVGDSPVSVALQHVREEPLPPSSVDPDVPPSADAIVLKALTKDRDHRYQTADEMREDIARALSGRPVLPPPVAAMATERMAPTMAVPGTATFPTVSDREPDRRETGSRALAYTLLAIAVLAVFVIAALVGKSLFGSGAARTQVPDVVGLKQAAAQQAITQAKLTVGEVTQENSSTVDPGDVIRQSPEPKSEVSEGDAVDLTVSAGVKQATVPTLVGLSLDEASSALRDAGLQLGTA